MKIEIYDPSGEAVIPETVITLRLEQGADPTRVQLNAVNPKTGARLCYGTIMSFSIGTNKLKFRRAIGCHVGGVNNKIPEEGVE